MENERKRKRITPTAMGDEPTHFRKIYDLVRAQSGARGELVIIYNENEDPYNILLNTANYHKLFLQVRNIKKPLKQSYQYQLSMDGEVLADAEYCTESAARQGLSTIALKELKKCCFSILKKSLSGSENAISKAATLNGGTSQSSSEDRPSVGGIGAMMMARMGWAGGGLGAQEQGQVDAVEIQEQVDRQGLGTKNITTKVTKMLADLAKSFSLKSLVFSKEFSKEERVQIHCIARRHDLMSRSYGKGSDRVLVVKCKLSRWTMIHQLQEAGGETEHYKLFYPSKFE